MTKNLEKTLQKYKKVDEIKFAKEREAINSRDTAIKAMIEKEKLLEAVAVIIKSPRSKTAQEKLKTLNIPSREPSVSDEKA